MMLLADKIAKEKKAPKYPTQNWFRKSTGANRHSRRQALHFQFKAETKTFEPVPRGQRVAMKASSDFQQLLSSMRLHLLGDVRLDAKYNGEDDGPGLTEEQLYRRGKNYLKKVRRKRGL